MRFSNCCLHLKTSQTAIIWAYERHALVTPNELPSCTIHTQESNTDLDESQFALLFRADRMLIYLSCLLSIIISQSSECIQKSQRFSSLGNLSFLMLYSVFCFKQKGKNITKMSRCSSSMMPILKLGQYFQEQPLAYY